MPLFWTVFWFERFFFQTFLFQMVLSLKFGIKTFRIKNRSDQKTLWFKKFSWTLCFFLNGFIPKGFYSEFSDKKPFGIKTFWKNNFSEQKPFGIKTVWNKNLSEKWHIRISTCTPSRGVASFICQEGQSAKTFPIFSPFSWFFSPLFPDFLPLFPNFWQFLSAPLDSN